MSSLETFASLDKAVITSLANRDSTMQMYKRKNQSNPVVEFLPSLLISNSAIERVWEINQIPISKTLLLRKETFL